MNLREKFCKRKKLEYLLFTFIDFARLCFFQLSVVHVLVIFLAVVRFYVFCVYSRGRCEWLSVPVQSAWNRLTTNLENLEYLGISTNMEN